MLAKEGYEGIDMSGLGAVAGQLAPERAVKLEGVGTDEMRVAREQSDLPDGLHRARLGAEPVNASDYGEEIVEGFALMYRLLLSERENLWAEGGPLARFAGDEVRVIVRDPYPYSLLLSESLHPDLLRDALDLERFFDRLWVGIEKHPYRARVIAAERADLLNGDVPLFSARPDSRHLRGNSAAPVADFFDETGLSLVRNRMRLLDEDDLARQVWFIRASLTTLRRQVERGRSSVERVGAFDGWGGVIYTLAHLGALWREPDLFDEAQEIVALLPGLIERDESFDIVGGAAGCVACLRSLHPFAPSDQALGIGLARLTTLAQLDDEETRAEIEVALRNTTAHGFGQNHSLCHGDLGNIELLSEYVAVTRDPRCAREVARLASVILESIEREGWLCGLPSGVESPGLMTGLAGIGYGLLRLAAPERVPSVLMLDPPAYADMIKE